MINSDQLGFYREKGWPLTCKEDAAAPFTLQKKHKSKQKKKTPKLIKHCGSMVPKFVSVLRKYPENSERKSVWGNLNEKKHTFHFH